VNGRYAVMAGADRRLEKGRVALVLDSGARDVILFDTPAGRALRGRRPAEWQASLESHAGARTIPVLRLPALHVATSALEDVIAAYVADPAGTRVEDGLLPTRFFSRVRIDPAAGFVELVR
jgi:hypothetical protein